jgi:hypothetical protein
VAIANVLPEDDIAIPSARSSWFENESVCMSVMRRSMLVGGQHRLAQSPERSARQYLSEPADTGATSFCRAFGTLRVGGERPVSTERAR